MDDGERLREESVGTAVMIRERVERMESLAQACEAEATEVERAAASTVARLRARAERLREQALEYRYAQHALETAPPGAIPKGDE